MDSIVVTIEPRGETAQHCNNEKKKKTEARNNAYPLHAAEENPFRKKVT